MSNQEHKEEYKMSPNMKLFFNRLLELKKFVKNKSHKSQEMKEVYEMLDGIIKSTDEKENLNE